MSEKQLKVLKKLNFEIQSWLEVPPKTLSRLRKFYDSIVSIQLGGEGLMGQNYNERLRGTPYKEIKKLYQNYKINYPGKED